MAVGSTLFPALYRLARGLRSNARVRYALVFWMIAGCAGPQMASGDGSPEVDAAQSQNPVDAPPTRDSALPDAATPDAAIDAAPIDARPIDAPPPPDAAPIDARPIDAPTPPDAAPIDALPIDARPPDLRLDTIDPDNALASAPLTGAVLTGNGFTADTTVSVGGAAATNCALVSPTQLRCDLPAGGTAAHVDVVATRGSDTSTLSGGFTWTSVSAAVTWCDVQWPASATATANAVSPYIYGQVYQGGMTDASNAPAAGIGAQLGWGVSGTDPRTDNGWRFAAAAPNPSYDFSQNNDEYYARVALPAGTYGYVYRFTLDGGLHFTYCDLDTANGGFDPTQEGTLTVTP